MIEPFTAGLISDLAGNMYGNVLIDGPVSSPQMSGNIKIEEGGLKVDYLGAKYNFNELNIGIENDKISIPSTTLTDELNNTGLLEADIRYSNFSNWEFRQLSLRSEHMVLMKTTRKENPDFYGYAIGEVDANITGTLEDLTIAVTAEPHKETLVNLPTYGSDNVEKHDFIRFINTEDSLAKLTVETVDLSVVNVNMFLRLTPDAEMRILIDPEGTEYLTAKGWGNLQIAVSSLGTVTMQGDLEIEEGRYDFSFQNLFPRTFTVKPGSSIIFAGDPLQAQLNLTAIYTVKQKVRASSLTGNTDDTESLDVSVLINISGNIESPEISFDIKAESDGGGFSEFDQRLQQVKADPNELNKQVFGLLITNNFLPQDITTVSGGGSSVSGTMNDFFASQISNYAQGFLSKYIEGAEINIGVESIDGASEEVGQEIQGELQQRVNDRIIFSVGVSYYDVDQTSSSGSNSNIGGDFEVQYLITEDGRIRATAFRVSEYDAIIAESNIKTGVGLNYTKEFNKISELWKRDEEKKKKKDK
jgi:hypothetical protein